MKCPTRKNYLLIGAVATPQKSQPTDEMGPLQVSLIRQPHASEHLRIIFASNHGIVMKESSAHHL